MVFIYQQHRRRNELQHCEVAFTDDIELAAALRHLFVGGLQLFVQRLQFFVGGFQLFIGRLQLLVGRLQFFVGGLQLLVGGFQFFVGRLQLLSSALQLVNRALHAFARRDVFAVEQSSYLARLVLGKDRLHGDGEQPVPRGGEFEADGLWFGAGAAPLQVFWQLRAAPRQLALRQQPADQFLFRAPQLGDRSVL